MKVREGEAGKGFAVVAEEILATIEELTSNSDTLNELSDKLLMEVDKFTIE
ncbi:hypothetical protein ACFIJ5_17165 [Haloimpatiens sp. FM7330]|uniref:hypothetical protein n=1 Tax=Haloimpatiens sp. FM7330 TaxID=3298610 RepID=UPI0036338216